VYSVLDKSLHTNNNAVNDAGKRTYTGMPKRCRLLSKPFLDAAKLSSTLDGLR
jgi:hypothetical protein